jgi:hypothetical protein
MSAGDVAIAASRHGLDKRRPVDIVAKKRPQPFDGRVETVLEVHERALGPETMEQFVPSDDVAWALEQGAQDLERLNLKLDAPPAFSQLSGAQVELPRPNP